MLGITGALSGLSNLGTQAQGPPTELNKSEADSAAMAWRQRRQTALDATLAAAPAQEGIGRALLGSIIAGVLAGAGGAGGPGGQTAMDTALGVGGELIQGRNQEALAQHAAGIQNATKVLESYDDLTKGMRMILQAQPGLIPSDMMPLAAEIAFPGTGLALQAKSAGLPASNQKMIEAIDFIIKSNDVRDPQELARLHNLRGTMMGLAPDQLTKPTSFIEGGLLDERWLVENAINGKLLAERQNRGERINIEDVDYKPKGKVSYDDETISALQRWSKVIVEQQLPREQAFDHLDPADQELLQKKFGGERTGELDLTSAANIALRTLLKGGETQQAISGGLGDEDYWNNLLGEYLQRAKENEQRQLQDSVEFQVEREQSRLMQEEGLDEADAEEQAVELIKKRLRKGGNWSRLDEDFRNRFGR